MDKNISRLVRLYPLFQWRVFWTVSVVEKGDGYLYHRWRNWVLKDEYDAFAGYNRRAQNRESTTFKVALSAYKERWAAAAR